MKKFFCYLLEGVIVLWFIPIILFNWAVSWVLTLLALFTLPLWRKFFEMGEVEYFVIKSYTVSLHLLLILTAEIERAFGLR